MGREEQREEREVLDSIFPDEIHDISDTEYRITIQLEASRSAGEETDDPVIILNVRYPDAYPDVAPVLDITQPPNAPKHAHLDIQADKARLLDALDPTIQESMGMAMVFALVSTLKDAAELLISERQQAIEDHRAAEARQAEEEENRKFEGQKVTRETFLAWRGRFQHELAEHAARRQAEMEAEEKKKRGGKVEEKKLTGKQLWEQGLAGKGADEDEEGEHDAMEAVKELRVEA